MEVLQSHEIESDHSDEEEQPTTQEAHIEPVVNPAALLPLSGQIESEHTHELTTTDWEQYLTLVLHFHH